MNQILVPSIGGLTEFVRERQAQKERSSCIESTSDVGPPTQSETAARRMRRVLGVREIAGAMVM